MPPPIAAGSLYSLLMTWCGAFAITCNVPLPDGVREVKVWARIHVARDGSAEDVKIVKSGGPEFDDAVRVAAGASRFLSPDEGGPEITVVEYVFPPPVPGGAPEAVQDDEPSAAERDAMLDALDASADSTANAASVSDTTAIFNLPPGTGAPIDSSAVRFGREGEDQ